MPDVCCSAHPNVLTSGLHQNELVKKLGERLRLKHSALQKCWTARLERWAFILSIRHPESVVWVRENLNVIALIATFLAAVQTQAISLTAQNNHTVLQSVANVFFFVGVFLDVLGGCIAFVAVAHLQNLSTLLHRRMKSVSVIMDALEKKVITSDCTTCRNFSLLRHHYQLLEILFQRILCDPGIWTYELGPLQDLTIRAEDVLHALDNEIHSTVHVHILEYKRTGDELCHMTSGTSIAYAAVVAAPLSVSMGVLCFVIGGLCFVKYGQPIAVWVSSFAVVFGTLFLFGIMVNGVSRTSRPTHADGYATSINT